MEKNRADFNKLTPELVIDAVEAALNLDLTNYTQPMPSYINRVYELKAEDDSFYIAKFYRPGRWSMSALLEEHRFILDCDEDDIPVAKPLPMTGLTASQGDAPTLGSVEGIPFAVFPRKGGRLWEAESLDYYLRIGRLLGRLHNTGARRKAAHRVRLSAADSFSDDLEILLSSNWIHPDVVEDVRMCLDRLRDIVFSVFSEADRKAEYIRVHGDFHSGNILDRPGEGLFLMDFDDMATSLPLQDIWLLLPDYAPDCRRETAAILEGYREFRVFDNDTLILIEPLRAMRMVYFLCWCGKQKDDFRFQHSFPDWGGKAFWQRETEDLANQYDQIQRALTTS